MGFYSTIVQSTANKIVEESHLPAQEKRVGVWETCYAWTLVETL